MTWCNSQGKVGFWGLLGIQILKVTYMSYHGGIILKFSIISPWSYLGKVFETMTNKIQSFHGFKNFRRFRGVCSSDTASSYYFRSSRVMEHVRGHSKSTFVEEERGGVC